MGGQGFLHASLAGIPWFLLYAVAGGALLVIFGALYIRLTPHHELEEIREGNVAAAIGFGGNLIGFAIPLSRCIQQAASIPDLVIWAMLALAVQFIIFLVLRLFIPDLSGRIERRDIAAGIALGAAAVAGGLINAASMTL